MGTLFPRTVTLVEAFRRILRAIYPERPGLADEIPTRSGWELSYPEEDIAKKETAMKEMAKLKEARELFGGLVAREKLRLRGVLDPSKALEEIDPADARNGVVDILAGELRVFLNNKVVRTYRQVHCHKTGVDRCVAELHAKTKRSKWTSPAGFEKFTADYKDRLNGEAPPTEQAFTDSANEAGHRRPREEIRQAWRNAFGPRRRGRRPTKLAAK